MWIKHKGMPIVQVAYPGQLQGADPADWTDANPGSGYAFAWPSTTSPALGTWARTEEGASVVVVGHGMPRIRDLKTLAIEEQP